jgi:hypothetical protein
MRGKYWYSRLIWFMHYKLISTVQVIVKQTGQIPTFSFSAILTGYKKVEQVGFEQ